MLGEEATRGRLGSLLDEAPAFLFTACHGLGFPAGDPHQRDRQGALVCQDWPGPGAGGIDREHYFAGEDVGEEAPTFCRSRDLSEDADRDLEREANVFGAELLMPEAAVREAWAELRAPGELAERFEVSLLAALWRLYSFGLVLERPT